MTTSTPTVPTLESEGGATSELNKLLSIDFPGRFPEDQPAGPVRNAYRASLAAIAVEAYAERTGSEEPLEQVLRDLLSDLHHLVDLMRDGDGMEHSFDSFAERAMGMYAAELAGE